jgi:cyclic pyranopterin phosphate synthase
MTFDLPLFNSAELAAGGVRYEPGSHRRRGPLPARLIDGFGRVHNSLRISITDRCNFRCVYCMPEEATFAPREHILTYEEIIRLAGLMTTLGVDRFRLTGGEPTVRRDLPTLVRGLHALPGVCDLSLTTNGARLAELARPLYEAGLRRLNVSLDSLDREKFARVTRRDFLSDVLEGLREAKRAGFDPIKVNAVAMRDFTEEELVAFARLGREEGYEVRFIEFMPLDGDNAWDRSRILSAEEIREAIGAVFPLVLDPATPPSDPARRYRFADGRGGIGIIASVTEPFCGSCNRLRLTADGKLRYCLFALEETDLKASMRAGAVDEDLAWMVVDTVARKWAGHMINAAGFVKPERNMSQIGG